MNEIYEWIQNTVVCYLVLTAVLALLPRGDYEQYFRLYLGLVLILVVLNPLVSGTELEEKLGSVFLQMGKQLDQFHTVDIPEKGSQDSRKAGRFLDEYRQQLSEDIKILALDQGSEKVKVWVQVEENTDSADFLRVKQIKLELNNRTGSEQVENLRKRVAAQYGMETEHVEIKVVCREGNVDSSNSGGISYADRDNTGVSQER